jgi:hypothetical protein
MAWAVARWGAADGLALVAAVLAAATVAAVAWNLPEPREPVATVAHDAPAARAASPGTSADGGAPGSATDAPPGSAAAPAGAPAPEPPAPEPLARVTALFAIGWLAQVAFLSQQMPLLVPKVGVASATAAVALTTAASLAGRLALSLVVDRIDHRAATAGSFLVQAAGMALLLVSDAPAAVLAGCVLFGLSVGNVVMLPAIFAQREFAAHRYGAVVARVWSVGQGLFALGPLGAGMLIAAAGSPSPTIAACLALQLVAAGLCAGRRAAPRRG